MLKSFVIEKRFCLINGKLEDVKKSNRDEVFNTSLNSIANNKVIKEKKKFIVNSLFNKLSCCDFNNYKRKRKFYGKRFKIKIDYRLKLRKTFSSNNYDLIKKLVKFKWDKKKLDIKNNKKYFFINYFKFKNYFKFRFIKYNKIFITKKKKNFRLSSRKHFNFFLTNFNPGKKFNFFGFINFRSKKFIKKLKKLVKKKKLIKKLVKKFRKTVDYCEIRKIYRLIKRVFIIKSKKNKFKLFNNIFKLIRGFIKKKKKNIMQKSNKFKRLKKNSVKIKSKFKKLKLKNRKKNKFIKNKVIKLVKKKKKILKNKKINKKKKKKDVLKKDVQKNYYDIKFRLFSRRNKGKFRGWLTKKRIQFFRLKEKFSLERYFIYFSRIKKKKNFSIQFFKRRRFYKKIPIMFFYKKFIKKKKKRKSIILKEREFRSSLKEFTYNNIILIKLFKIIKTFIFFKFKILNNDLNLFNFRFFFKWFKSNKEKNFLCNLNFYNQNLNYKKNIIFLKKLIFLFKKILYLKKKWYFKKKLYRRGFKFELKKKNLNKKLSFSFKKREMSYLKEIKLKRKIFKNFFKYYILRNSGNKYKFLNKLNFSFLLKKGFFEFKFILNNLFLYSFKKRRKFFKLKKN